MSEGFKKSAARDTLESLVVTVILAIFGTTFVLQAFKIPTGSMEDTLLIGDHLLVNKFVFANHAGGWSRLLPFREIQRGDVVVFKFPYSDNESQEPGEHFVKRVIGVPGDRIRIVHRRVFVNDKEIQEPFVRHSFPNQASPGDDFPPSPSQIADELTRRKVSPGDDFSPSPSGELSGSTLRWMEGIQDYLKDGELLVPPGDYFVMGDNREQSWDSRFWGFVPRELVSGKPVMIYWSYETPRGEYMRNSLTDRVSQTFDLVVHFFPKTRWRRTFRFVH